MRTKTQQAPAPAGTAVLDAGKLKAIYAAMLRLQVASQELKPPARRQIAVWAGVLSQLREGDAVAGLASDLLPAVFPGGPLHLIPTAQDHLARLQIPAGVALASRFGAHGGVVVVVFCDAFVSDRQSNAALEYASAQMLPILYVELQGSQKPRKQVWKHTFPSIPVDMHDAIAIYRVAYESLQRARQGGGPTWMECQAWQVRPRLRAASGGPGESDPVAKIEHYLSAKGLHAAEWKSEGPVRR